jgi:hypothetical protein
MSRACIPFHILFDKDLSKNELILYGMIEHMESDNMAVYFNNRTIAKKLGVSHESKIVRKMISHLTEKGYIKREHKQIQIKRKGVTHLEWRWCFNTVKTMVVESDDDDQGGVPEIPGGGVPEIPPYNTPFFTPPLKETTTTCSSSLTPFEKKALSLKLSSDNRTDEEFIENIHHHIANNSDSTKSEYQRQQMILKLLKDLKQASHPFQSTGFLSHEARSTFEKEKRMNQLIAQYNEHVARIKSDITLKLLPKETTIVSFKEWCQTHGRI